MVPDWSRLNPCACRAVDALNTLVKHCHKQAESGRRFELLKTGLRADVYHELPPKLTHEVLSELQEQREQLLER